jgi:hypothetical protein
MPLCELFIMFHTCRQFHSRTIDGFVEARYVALADDFTFPLDFRNVHFGKSAGAAQNYAH